MGDGQNRGQIASQLDPELALLRSQDNRLNEPAEHLRGLQTGVLAPERSGELFDSRPVEVGDARVQERRRLVGRLDLLLQSFLPLLKPLHPALDLTARHTAANGVDHLLDLAPHPLELALGARKASSLLHSQPIHLLGELLAELLEELLPEQLGLQSVEHARFDLQTRDPQRVRAGPAVPRAEAAEEFARMDDEAGAALPALRQAREEVFRPAELPEPILLGRGRPFPLHRCVPISDRPPRLVVDDSKLRDLLDDPRGLRIRPRDPLAGVGVLQESLTVPNHAPDVQLVVEDANAAFRVPMNRARTPQRALRPWNGFLVESLANVLGRGAGGVVAEDPSDDRCLLLHYLALARRDLAILEATHDPIAVAQTATGLAVLDAPAKAAARLVGELAQIHRVHRPLEADVQEGDVAFSERDDGDAGECQAFEQAGGVFLIAAESIERFGQHDVDLLAESDGHHLLETNPHQRRARDRAVGVLAGDRPALAVRELATDAELINDRCLALVFGGVPRVDGNLHGKPSGFSGVASGVRRS